MTTEERILAYLDGSLSEQESAELMHQLSVSPENRVILEQHIKLSEMTRLAQKPFEVPAALEANLAERLPAIGAASSAAGGASSSRSALSSLLLLLRQYPVRFALGGIVALLAGGMLYYYAETSTPALTSSNAPSSDPVNNTSVHSNSEHSSASDNSSSNSIQQPSVQSPTVRSVAADGKGGAAELHTEPTGHPAPHITKNSVELRHFAGNNASLSSSLKSGRNSNSRRGASKTISDESETITNSMVDLTNSSSTNNNSANAIDQRVTTPSPVTALASIPLAAINPVASDAIGATDGRGIPRAASVPTPDPKERSRFSVRASIGLGETFLYVPTGSSSYNSRLDGLPLIGLDYSFNPYWSVGLEGGFTSMLALSPTSSAVTSSDGITNIVTHSTTTSSTPGYLRGVVRYTFNPFTTWMNVELSAGFGAVMSSTTALMSSAQLALSYPLVGGLDIQFSGLFSGVWSRPSTTAPAVSGIPSNAIVSYETTDVPASTILTPAFTIRVGAVYHF